MRLLTTQLIASLQNAGLKLASAMRTIGWLRRVAPELDAQFGSMQKGGTSTTWQKRPIVVGPASGSSFGNTDGALGALFLVCRLKSLVTMLEALEPLRELADNETRVRLSSDTGQHPIKGNANTGLSTTGGSTGQQTERYLKRYIEIFREQSFAILSTYRSIFPSALPVPGSTVTAPDIRLQTSSPTASNDRFAQEDWNKENVENGLLPIPSPLATFPAHLVDMLLDTLRIYLPNVKDKAARESLLTQVLYCAGSMGRLGGDFGLITALLRSEAEDDGDEDVDEEEEWVEVMRRHRVQASRLELLASGVGVGSGRSISVPLRRESEVV